MKLRILVFDPDTSLRELLQLYLQNLGHDVQAYREPHLCPLFTSLDNEQCCCPRESPCADIVFMDMRMPHISAFDFLQLQRRRGCKALDANKAVMSTSVTKAVKEAMAAFGCNHILKPFRLAEIRIWIEECASRIK